MKAKIHDHDGWLRVQVEPENIEERMLLRAFLREHEQTTVLAIDFIEDQSNALIVTFGEKPKPRTI